MRQAAFTSNVIQAAQKLLAVGGSLVVKCSQGASLQAIISTAQSKFDFVYTHKPKSSRSESNEVFIVAIKYDPNKKPVVKKQSKHTEQEDQAD